MSQSARKCVSKRPRPYTNAPVGYLPYVLYALARLRTWAQSARQVCTGRAGHSPDDIHPGPKPRPALILAVFDDDAPQFTVRVAYGVGTSQRTTTLHRGEFSILRDRDPATPRCRRRTGWRAQGVGKPVDRLDLAQVC